VLNDMENSKVLIVDDEPDIRELIQMTLKRMDINSDAVSNLSEAKSKLKSSQYFVCLADMRLPDGDGIDLVTYVQTHNPGLPIAVITAYGNIEGAVNTLKAGAYDYVSKPINITMLRNLVTTARTLVPEGTTAKAHEGDNKCSTNLIGNSALIRTLKKTIIKLARSQAPVFINGDSGVGKELVARLIHEQSPRALKPFVPVNCGAIPTELMESEFFGYKKGSFSGATSDKEGLFEAANGGTLFFDEIAELPIHMQVKLLRAIQEKSIRPIGNSHEVSVDVRILSASHRNLNDMVLKGDFRRDLFYRINVIDVFVPSLAMRKEDIPLLAEHILGEIAKRHNVSGFTLSEDCVSSLMQYEFPGNIRELENILERAFALAENNCITAGDVQLETIRQSSAVNILPPSSQPGDESLSVKTTDTTLDGYLNTTERERIMIALQKTKWNKTAAAKALGLSLRALRYRIEKLQID